MAEDDTTTYWDEFTSPLNLVLMAFIVYLLYKIIKSHFESAVPSAPPPPPMPKLRKDLTVAELKKYDGTNEEGRVLLAVNGIIFDVTKGKRFYGPGKCNIIAVLEVLSFIAYKRELICDSFVDKHFCALYKCEY